MFGAYAPLFRKRQFVLFWLGQVISTLGDAVFRITLLLLVTEISSSPLALTFVMSMQIIPAIIIGPVAGVFVDRWDRRRVMIIADIVRAGLVLILLLDNSLPTIAFSCVLLTVAGAFFNPARPALVPDLVGRGSFVTASSLTESSFMLVSSAGPVIGGILVGFRGASAALAFNALTFLASALALVWMGRIAVSAAISQTSQSFQQSFKEGLVAITGVPALAFVVIIFTLSLFSLGGMNILLVDYIRNTLQTEAQQFGLVQSVMFFSVMASTLLMGQIGQRLNKGKVILNSLTVIGLATTCFFLRPGLALIFVWSSILGSADGFISIPFFALLVEKTTPAVRGRVMGVITAIMRVGGLLGLNLAGLGAAKYGSVITLTLLGLMLVLVGLISRLHPGYKALIAADHGREESVAAAD